MTSFTRPPLADREVLLDAWVAKRAEIARLEAEAVDLLATRVALFDQDVAAHPVHRDMARRSMVAEYTAAGRAGSGSVENAFADAEALTTYFPGLHDALRRGAISVQHVRAIISAADPVRDAVRNRRIGEESFAMYEQACIAVAEQDSPTRTRVAARQISAVIAGESLKERHRRAVDERCVTIRSLDEGMALLTAVLPEVYAVAIKDRLRRLAKAIAHASRTAAQDAGEAASCAASASASASPSAAGAVDPAAHASPPRAAANSVIPEGADLDDWPEAADLFPDDPRLDAYDLIMASDTYAMDPELDRSRDHDDADEDGSETEEVAADGRTRAQIEADALVDLLLAARLSDVLGSGLDNIQATVQVTVAATTLAGDDDRLTEFDGHGPLDPSIARDLAGRAGGWNRLFLDSAGMVTKVDRYTPTGAMKRFLRARDQRCRFPGCHTPAHRCEIDHNVDYAKGGLTELTNLADFCPGHHPLKHPDLDDILRWTAHQLAGGIVRWVSPLGRTYDDHPPRRIMFV
ncbi:HNH endonuclease signature motif containing protein [Microbacterium xylanilyticum]